jgi:nucleoside-diphosphate-sugar epimerase
MERRSGMKILVTGATGFLGTRLVERLCEAGHSVRATGRNLAAGQVLTALGAEFIPGAIEDQAFVASLLPGMEAVIHTAGLSSPWGKYEAFYQANVQGTENVILGCFQHTVPRLVHVSTPSLYVEYRDRANVRESDPLPATFVNAYAATKYEAEQRVWAASLRGLETVMIRPRALVGRGDTVIMPRLIRAHQEGRLRVIGTGQNRVDLTSVANVVDALLLGLTAEGPALGEAYNITNGDPVNLWDTVEQVFQHLGLTLNRRRIPFAVAFAVAKGMEAAARFDPAFREPPLTCYSVGMLAKTQTLNIDKARTLLGYTPRQSLTDAIGEFVPWWQSLGGKSP